MSNAAARTFYRIVLTDPPTLADFTSYLAQGKIPLAGDPETLELMSGISVWNTATQARNKALDYPGLGQYIATLRIPEGGRITYRRTGSNRGHHTLWGEPQDLLACIVTVVPMTSAES